MGENPLTLQGSLWAVHNYIRHRLLAEPKVWVMMRYYSQHCFAWQPVKVAENPPPPCVTDLGTKRITFTEKHDSMYQCAVYVSFFQLSLEFGDI